MGIGLGLLAGFWAFCPATGLLQVIFEFRDDVEETNCEKYGVMDNCKVERMMFNTDDSMATVFPGCDDENPMRVITDNTDDDDGGWVGEMKTR
jgi:hypothetical protein